MAAWNPDKSTQSVYSCNFLNLFARHQSHFRFPSATEMIRWFSSTSKLERDLQEEQFLHTKTLVSTASARATEELSPIHGSSEKVRKSQGFELTHRGIA